MVQDTLYKALFMKIFKNYTPNNFKITLKLLKTHVVIEKSIKSST